LPRNTAESEAQAYYDSLVPIGWRIMHLYKAIIEFDAAVCLQRQIFLFTP